ncbi:MAG: hypothetical protein KAH10_03450 [Flavobacteriales bacterium]|nr:hypothetical protein [Flavobacteriales bacterium]
MNIVKSLFLVIFIMSFSTANAQYYDPEGKGKKEGEKEQPANFMDKVHFGGSLSLQFGSYTSVYVAPIAFYDVTNNFMLGVGFNYIYQKYNYTNQDYSSSIYGPKLSAIFKPFKQLIISSDFEYNYYNRDFNNYGETVEAYWHPTWYVGVGYGVPIGKRGGMYFSMSYDLMFDASKSYYSTAWRPTIGAYF